MTPGGNLLSALPLVVGMQGESQLSKMFGGVPEVEDALGQREVLAKEFFQPAAAVRQCDLLVGLVPAHLRRLAAELRAQFVQVVKTR